MATSFARIDVPDPNKILDFVETSTSSVAAVFEVCKFVVILRYWFSKWQTLISSIHFQSLNSILMASDASELPVTDFEAAASLPYDTDIPDGKFNEPWLFYMCLVIKILSSCIIKIHLKFKANAEIPEDPEVALRQNAVKIIREDAVIQAKKMIALVESISATTIKNSVVGESFRTKSKGIKQIIQKYAVIFLSY